MKDKSTKAFLIFIVVCFILFNVSLLFLNRLHKDELKKAKHRLEQLDFVEIMLEASKETTVTRFKYEQRSIGNSPIYFGSDKNVLIPLHSITNQPKMVIGLNQNMCRPCVEGVFAYIKEIFPDFESNPNIICIADIEQRFKDDYYGKKVISFHQKEDHPLYEIIEMPYLFILDKDLCIKLLFISDTAIPELIKEYLKTIKERYTEI